MTRDSDTSSVDSFSLLPDSDGAVAPHKLWSLLLVVAILLLYWPVRDFEFVQLDDVEHILRNDLITAGLSWDGIQWAFDYRGADYFHPLTWLTHMLDFTLFRHNAGGHHLLNVLLHCCNAVLLFQIFRVMTRRDAASLIIAALFALHPLRVEAVAWVYARKDILSGFLWFVCMASYLWYVRSPGWRRGILTAVVFVLGLLAKPILVVLPAIFLMLDYWPLQRFELGDLTVVEGRRRLLGLTLAEQGEHREAVQAFRKVVELCPEHVAAWRNLGISSARVGDPVTAREALDALHRLHRPSVRSVKEALERKGQ